MGSGSEREQHGPDRKPPFLRETIYSASKTHVFNHLFLARSKRELSNTTVKQDTTSNKLDRRLHNTVPAVHKTHLYYEACSRRKGYLGTLYIK